MHREREWARAVVRDAASRYLASRRDRVDAFVDRHFSFAGTLRLHRRTIGWDLLRVPANLLLAPATFGLAVLGASPRGSVWRERRHGSADIGRRSRPKWPERSHGW